MMYIRPHTAKSLLKIYLRTEKTIIRIVGFRGAIPLRSN